MCLVNSLNNSAFSWKASPSQAKFLLAVQFPCSSDAIFANRGPIGPVARTTSFNHCAAVQQLKLGKNTKKFRLMYPLRARAGKSFKVQLFYFLYLIILQIFNNAVKCILIFSEATQFPQC